VVFDGSDDLFVTDYNTDQISKISPDGLSVSTFVTLPANSYPRGLALDRAGNFRPRSRTRDVGGAGRRRGFAARPRSGQKDILEEQPGCPAALTQPGPLPKQNPN
jgi:hypothetical protein